MNFRYQQLQHSGMTARKAGVEGCVRHEHAFSRLMVLGLCRPIE